MGKPVLILGLTGNIASGKSSVAELLRRKGARLLSADQLAREVVAPGTALLTRVVGLFGDGVLQEDGQLDRQALAQRVFSDAEARSQLNALLHPAIGRLAEQRLAEMCDEGDSLVVYEAPLLFEAGAEKRVDRILVVTISPQEQLRRLIQRDKLGSDDARRRIAAQMSQADKVARADFVVDNSGSLEELEVQVEKLWRELSAG